MVGGYPIGFKALTFPLADATDSTSFTLIHCEALLLVTIYFATRQCLGGIEAFIELNSRFMPASLQWQYRTPMTTDKR